MITAIKKIDIDTLVEMELPPLPGSALRVSTLAQDMNSSTRIIADAISCDPVLSARILRAANSPLYGMERRVTALPMAVNALGNNAIHLLVIVFAASEAFDQKDWRTPVGRKLWEHSLAVGMAARELSTALGMRGGEEAFLCGLLHDIGKLLLLRHDPTAYSGEDALDEDEETMLQREQAIYGYTHAQVGALVARRWGLPEEISYAIYNHHQPSEAGHSMLMARLIDVADGLANAAGMGLRRATDRDLTITESVIALRLTDEQLRAVWEKAEASLSEIKGLFN